MPCLTGTGDERERNTHFPSGRVRVRVRVMREERKGDENGLPTLGWMVSRAGGREWGASRCIPDTAGPRAAGSLWRRRAMFLRGVRRPLR